MLAFHRWLFGALVCTSALTSAQAPKPLVMPFPLELKRTPSGFSSEDAAGLQREYTRLLRLAGATLPDFGAFELALKELKRSDCEREDQCLMQLARNAGALYGLYASVDYTLEGAVVVSGRVVRDDGKIVSPFETVKLAKGRDSFKDITKNALTQLFVQLKIGELPATRPVEIVKDPTKEPVTDPLKDPPPPLPPLVVEDLGAGQRNAGKGLVYGGAGAVVVGGVLAGVGAGLGYGKSLDGQNVPREQLNDVVAARTLTTVGFVAMGVGAVSAIVGAVLWGTAAPPPSVAVVPVNGGGVVQFGGEF